MSYTARVPMQVYEMRLFCDCGGEMRSTGISRPTDPPQYEHRCEDCHTTEYVQGKAYPHLVYSDGGLRKAMQRADEIADEISA